MSREPALVGSLCISAQWPSYTVWKDLTPVRSKEGKINSFFPVLELSSWHNNGTSYKRFRMTNRLGITVELCSLGAMVTVLKTPDRRGIFKDVILGFDNAGDYLEDSNPYFGSTIGRVANRYILTVAKKPLIILYSFQCLGSSLLGIFNSSQI